MDLTGKTLNHYRIVAPIGKGGMGEVYLAEDTKLGREVALKVLPALMAGDPDRRARFEREAKSVAALNHPNIVTIHSVEEAQGVHFITMELVRGEPLSRKIPRGGLTLDRLLSFGVTMADAVGAAHKQGIVHRDLKPDNLVVGHDGRLKVLDFGLAKLRPDASEAVTSTQLPTEAITQEGKVLGTVAYMSPEQAEGKAVDARSDIFSLGVVLYEMATGRRPFTGDTPVSTMSAILKDTPESVIDLNRTLPRHLGRIVNRCLAKDPERRYQTAIDLRNDLEVLAEEVRSGESLAVGQLTVRGRASRRRWLIPALVALMLVAVAYGVASRFAGRGDYEDSPRFSEMKMTPLTTNGRSEEAAISPDGKYVVYVQTEGGNDSLWLRQVNLPSGVRIVPPSGEVYYDPTFSPEGDEIYYLKNAPGADPTLYRVPVLGGSSIKVLEDVGERVSFSPDGSRFVFTRWVPPSESQLLVADRGGENVKILARRTEPDEYVGDPAWSPGGDVVAVVGVRWTGRMEHHLYTVPVEGGAERAISTRGWGEIDEIAWLPGGDALVFDARERSFGLDQLWEMSYPGGRVRRITNDLNSYHGVGLTGDGHSLVTVLIERESSVWTVIPETPGEEKEVPAGSRQDGDVGLAWTHDGRIVHGANNGGEVDIWISDPVSGESARLTFEGGYEPSVCPDGRSILFVSDRDGSPNLWRMGLDGSDQVRLTSGESETRPVCHSDGQRVVYMAQGESLVEIMDISTGGGKPTTLVPEERNVAWFAVDVSPDGRSLAYLVWDETNRRWRLEIRSLDGNGPVRNLEITDAFADAEWASIRWSPDGRSIHYVDHEGGVGNLWALPLDGSPPRPVTGFESGRMEHFAWSPDGTRLGVTRGQRRRDVVLLKNFR